MSQKQKNRDTEHKIAMKTKIQVCQKQKTRFSIFFEAYIQLQAPLKLLLYSLLSFVYKCTSFTIYLNNGSFHWNCWKIPMKKKSTNPQK